MTSMIFKIEKMSTLSIHFYFYVGLNSKHCTMIVDLYVKKVLRYF
jgi:hypothetical protein